MTFNQRHAHMRGTTSVLRTAFGREYGADRAGELLDLPQPRRGRSPDECVRTRQLEAMQRNQGHWLPISGEQHSIEQLLPHLVRTIEILEPTVVHHARREYLP